MYTIVCPMCGAVNSLHLVRTETKTWKLSAQPSPASTDRGTYYLVSNEDTINASSITKLTRCNQPDCPYIMDGQPPSKAVVRQESPVS